MHRKHFLFAGLSIGLMDGLLYLQSSNYIWLNVIWFFVPILAIAGIILLFTTKNKPIASFVLFDIIITIALIKVVATVFSTISSISKYPDYYSSGYYVFLGVSLILFNLQTLGLLITCLIGSLIKENIKCYPSTIKKYSRYFTTSGIMLAFYYIGMNIIYYFSRSIFFGNGTLQISNGYLFASSILLTILHIVFVIILLVKNCHKLPTLSSGILLLISSNLAFFSIWLYDFTVAPEVFVYLIISIIAFILIFISKDTNSSIEKETSLNTELDIKEETTEDIDSIKETVTNDEPSLALDKKCYDTNSTIQSIKGLKELLDLNAITEEEFKSLKEKIIFNK